MAAPADTTTAVDFGAVLDAAGPFEPIDLMPSVEAAGVSPVETGPELEALVAPADASGAGDLPAPPVAGQGLDPALAVTPTDGTAAAPAVEPIAFDDQLADPVTDGLVETSAEPVAEVDPLGTAVVNVDEAVGFELDPTEDATSTGAVHAVATTGADDPWGGLDLLDLADEPEPATPAVAPAAAVMVAPLPPPAADVADPIDTAADPFDLGEMAVDVGPDAAAAAEVHPLDDLDDAAFEVADLPTADEPASPAVDGGFSLEPDAAFHVADAAPQAQVAADDAAHEAFDLSGLAASMAVATPAALLPADAYASPLDLSPAFDVPPADHRPTFVADVTPIEPVADHDVDPDARLDLDPAIGQAEPLEAEAVAVPVVPAALPGVGGAVVNVEPTPEVIEVASVVETPWPPAAEDAPADAPTAVGDAVVNVDDLASTGTAAEPAPPAADDVGAARMSGPSLFGFNFEGGSFLGGMPLPLNGPPAPLPPGGIVFDSTGSTTSPSAPADPAAAAVAPPAAPASEESIPPSAESAPRVRPPTPPRPLGLTGLVNGTGVAALPAAVPPLPVPPAGGFAPANGRTRTADVFSQMAGPIGVAEAFGGRPGEPILIPEVDRSTPVPPAAPPGTPPLQRPAGLTDAAPSPAQPLPPAYTRRPPNAGRLIPPPLPRKSKIRLLLGLCVGLPIAWAAGVYGFMNKTATVDGRLHYAGLSSSTQSESARRLFHSDQVQQLVGDQVRTNARALLTATGQPPGVTEDGVVMGQAMQDQTLRLEWLPDELDLIYQAPDAAAGKAQISALLTNLRANDEKLNDARSTAVHELDEATAALAAAKADDAAARTAWQQQLAAAADHPDPDLLAALARTADAAVARATAVQADRVATESALAGWKRQDPGKPAAAANDDPELAGLRHQLQQAQAQIDKARQLQTSAHPDAPAAAAAADDDPLMAQFVAKAKSFQARIDQRLAALAAVPIAPGADRARRREAEIERLTVQLTTQQRAESTASAAAVDAATALTAGQGKVDAARIAEARAADLNGTFAEAEAKLKQAGDDQAAKQRAVDAAITVDGSAASNPSVSVPAGEHDPRPLVAAVGGGLLLVGMFVWLLGIAGTGEDSHGGDPHGYAESDPSENAEVDAEYPVGV